MNKQPFAENHLRSRDQGQLRAANLKPFVENTGPDVLNNFLQSCLGEGDTIADLGLDEQEHRIAQHATAHTNISLSAAHI